MNRPTIVERDNCSPYLVQELAALSGVRVIVALGAFAWDAAVRMITAGDVVSRARRRPKFGHGAEAVIGPYHLIGAFHPSQRNTFTGRLRPSMLDGGVDAAVVEAIISLGAALHVSVIAEGIEDAATAKRLLELGCPLGQGYHFGRPEALSALEARLAPWSRPSAVA